MRTHSHADTVRTLCVTATSNIYSQRRSLLFRHALTFMSIPPSFVNPWPSTSRISPNNTLKYAFSHDCKTTGLQHSRRRISTPHTADAVRHAHVHGAHRSTMLVNEQLHTTTLLYNSRHNIVLLRATICVRYCNTQPERSLATSIFIGKSNIKLTALTYMPHPKRTVLGIVFFPKQLKILDALALLAPGAIPLEPQ